MLDKGILDAPQELFALNAPRLYCRRYLLVAHGIGIAEGQVFKLTAHFAHAQPVRQRRVDIQCLARDCFLPIRFQMLQGAHVVQPVGQLDQHHAHIAHHGQQHLAHVLGLPVFSIGELDLVDLGHALDDVRHLVAEALADLFAGCRSILHGIVQQGGGDCRRIQFHLRQHLCHLERVHNVGFAGGARLPFVVAHAEVPRLANQ